MQLCEILRQPEGLNLPAFTEDRKAEVDRPVSLEEIFCFLDQFHKKKQKQLCFNQVQPKLLDWIDYQWSFIKDYISLRDSPAATASFVVLNVCGLTHSPLPPYLPIIKKKKNLGSSEACSHSNDSSSLPFKCSEYAKDQLNSMTRQSQI